MLKDQARDLEADLALCEAATPGPWINLRDTSICTEKTDREGWHDEIIRPRTPRPRMPNMVFIATAREGWPYAIRRALELEAEVDRLRNELQTYQNHHIYD